MAREYNSKTYNFDDNTDDRLLITGPGWVGRLCISGVGTAATVNVYDNTSASGVVIYSWVTADGKINQLLECKVTNGLYIDIGGTTPVGFITYADGK